MASPPVVTEYTEKESRIIEAAKEVFSEKGFADATVDEVADLAGVGKGTVYRHFGNKEDLMTVIFDYCFNECTSRICRICRS